MRHWFKDQHFQSVLKNTSYLAVSKGIAGLAGLAVLAFAGRSLGVLQLGILILIVSYAKAASGLSKFQSWQLVVRYSGQVLAKGDTTQFKEGVGFALGLDAKQVNQLTKIMLGLFRLFNEKDLALVELNPLAIMTDGNLAVLDGKINSDDNATFRHADLAAMRDIRQEDETEVLASQHDLNYVTMDGNIGCMVNGAGLAMATMDVIKLNGGEPANFLDVGGGATKERVTEAFKLILRDADVKAIFVNIFGGIVRCDMIAEGIIAAVKEVDVKVPVIVRLEGTNVEAGKDILKNSGLAIIAADDINDGAKKAVAAAAGK